VKPSEIARYAFSETDRERYSLASETVTEAKRLADTFRGGSLRKEVLLPKVSHILSELTVRHTEEDSESLLAWLLAWQVYEMAGSRTVSGDITPRVTDGVLLVLALRHHDRGKNKLYSTAFNYLYDYYGHDFTLEDALRFLANLKILLSQESFFSNMS